jgi:hypothetical protein
MSGMAIQEYLFQRIREKLPLEVSLADAIAELLHVSTDSAYRRIRGETPLVLDEATTLCKAYGLSFDQLLQTGDNSVIFNYTRLDNTNYNFEKYLQGILHALKAVAAAEQKQIIYLTKDLAFFHNFCFRPLFAFHHFFWMKSMLQHPDYVNLKFSMELLTPELEKTGKQILKTYNDIPSIEIWNSECVNSTIAQIEYYREAGYFKTEDDVSKIYQALNDTIEHLKNQAERGCKYLPGENPEIRKNNFAFFHNRVVLGDNTIMAVVNTKKILYINYEVLNYMTTQDEKFCNDVYLKLHTLMRRGTILSNASEKQRNMFFNNLQRKIPRHAPNTF